MTQCPDCKGKLKKEIENVYEIDGTKYFDYRLDCENCGYSKPITVERKNPVPKAPDAVTEMTATLKLREYMPKRKVAQAVEHSLAGESLKEAFHPLKHTREAAIYLGAIVLGVLVEILGLYFESYLAVVRINPLVGFLISLSIFVFAPIIVVGSMVYYATKDRLKAILLGSMAVPITIILIANLGLEAWIV